MGKTNVHVDVTDALIRDHFKQNQVIDSAFTTNPLSYLVILKDDTKINRRTIFDHLDIASEMFPLIERVSIHFASTKSKDSISHYERIV